MQKFHFANKEYFYVLIVVLPTILASWYVGFRNRQKGRRQFGEDRLVDRYSHKLFLSSEIGDITLWSVALIFLVAAIAGPIQSDAPVTAQKGSLQVIMLMDVSKSTRAKDCPLVPTGEVFADEPADLRKHSSRLDMAKHLILNTIMPAIPDNEIGIVAYSGGGFPHAPITESYKSLKFILDNWVSVLEPAAPGGGSHMVDGLEMALRSFKQKEKSDIDNNIPLNKEKVLVILSDGGFDDTIPELDKVLKTVVEQRMRVIVIGIGGNTATTIPEYKKGEDGEYHFDGWAQKDDGSTPTTAYDPTTLQHVADKTGGRLIRVENENNLKINWATKIAGSKTEKNEAPVFQYPLAVSLGLIFMIYINRRMFS